MTKQELFNAYHTNSWFFELYSATRKQGYKTFQYCGIVVSVKDIYEAVNG